MAQAVSRRRHDLAQLLLEHGAPRQPWLLERATCSGDLDTVHWHLSHGGDDLCRDHALAKKLIQGVRSLLKWAKERHENPRVQAELSVALCHHMKAGHIHNTALLLWAGANPSNAGTTANRCGIFTHNP